MGALLGPEGAGVDGGTEFEGLLQASGNECSERVLPLVPLLSPPPPPPSPPPPLPLPLHWVFAEVAATLIASLIGVFVGEIEEADSVSGAIARFVEGELLRVS